MSRLRRRECRRSSPPQALHSGTQTRRLLARGCHPAASIVVHPGSFRQPTWTSRCPVCGERLALPWVMTNRGPVHIRCLGLEAVDDVCAQFAEHVDALATLAKVRDDSALVRLALDADHVCSTLHRAYANLAAASCDEEVVAS